VEGGASTFLLLVRLVVSLGLILGMVGIAAWALKRRGVVARAGGAGAAVRVLDRRSLTKNAHVALVEVDGRRYVLGITDHRVDLLGGAGGPAPASAPDAATAALLEDGPPTDATAVPDIGAAATAARHRTPASRGRGRRTPALHRAPGGVARVATTSHTGAGQDATGQDTTGPDTTGSASTGRARRTGTSASATADGTSRMGFVDAMRELTVRRS
jgi:flagellar protein FliO/FliZ